MLPLRPSHGVRELLKPLHRCERVAKLTAFPKALQQAKKHVVDLGLDLIATDTPLDVELRPDEIHHVDDFDGQELLAESNLPDRFTG